MDFHPGVPERPGIPTVLCFGAAERLLGAARFDVRRRTFFFGRIVRLGARGEIHVGFLLE
jgi:hypothetical protein